jgi:hypothetical protein
VPVSKNATCYMCPAPATTREHAPPKCFFPEGFRTNLITVPSCPDHNSIHSRDVEYTRNVLCTQRGANATADAVFQTARRSFDYSPNLMTQTFRTMRPFGDGGTFRVDLPRHRKVMRAIAFALYFRDNSRKHEGDWRIFTPSFLVSDSLHYGRPDPWVPLRSALKSLEFTPGAVMQPGVFKYGVLQMGGGQIGYRFEFYEAVVVIAWPLPHRLSPSIFLPIGLGPLGTVWELAEG